MCYSIEDYAIRQPARPRRCPLSGGAIQKPGRAERARANVTTKQWREGVKEAVSDRRARNSTAVARQRARAEAALREVLGQVAGMTAQQRLDLAYRALAHPDMAACEGKYPKGNSRGLKPYKRAWEQVRRQAEHELSLTGSGP